LESRLNALEARLADEEEDSEEAGWPKLEWEDTSGAKFENKLAGRIMLDGVMWANQNDSSLGVYDNQPNYVEFRRIRLGTAGSGFGVFNYKIEFDFEPEGDSSLSDESLEPFVSIKDVYMGINEVPFFGTILVGNQKEAFSLEELTSSRHITFLERALPNAAFVPARRTGIGSYNYSPGEQFTLAYGAYFDEPWINVRKEIVGDRQGINLPIRATWCPFYEAGGRGVLHLGGGAIYRDDRDDRVRFRARPNTHEGDRWVDTGVMAVDYYYNTNLEAAMVYGPFSLQGELFYTHSNNINGTPDGDFYGAYFYGSWFITGENRAYRRSRGVFDRVKPSTNFWLVRTVDGGKDMGWGAWEVACRWAYLDLSDAVAWDDEDGVAEIDDEAGILHNLTCGLNWYWNPNMRMMFNYTHPWSGVAGSPLVNEGDILSMRFQVDF
jgi:phosphate-selective porin OprO/OprP